MSVKTTKTDSLQIPRSRRAQIFQRDNYTCWYCGTELIRNHVFDWQDPLFRDMPVIDHIVPIVKGGSDSDENLRTSCWKCNNFKKDKTVEEFREYLELKHSVHFRAYLKIDSILAECETPFDDELSRIKDWLLLQVEPVVFHGEKL